MDREVPGVNCYLELELVETPKCYPVPVEECDDILKVGSARSKDLVMVVTNFICDISRKSHILWTTRSVTWSRDLTAIL